jgi:hypothetical protein
MLSLCPLYHLSPNTQFVMVSHPFQFMYYQPWVIVYITPVTQDSDIDLLCLKLLCFLNCPSSDTQKKEHNTSITRYVLLLMWKSGEEPTQLGPTEGTISINRYCNLKYDCYCWQWLWCHNCMYEDVSAMMMLWHDSVAFPIVVQSLLLIGRWWSCSASLFVCVITYCMHILTHDETEYDKFARQIDRKEMSVFLHHHLWSNGCVR